MWFIPVVVQIIDLTPLYFSNSQEKVDLLNAISNQKLNFQPQSEGFIFPEYFHSMFKIFLAFICDILILKNIIEYYKKRKAPQFIKNKFFWAAILFGISLIFQTIPYFLAFTLNHPFQLVFIHSMAFGILSISIFLIFTPGLLYDEIYFSKIKMNKEELALNIEENSTAEENLEDNKFDINESTCLECKQKIIDTMIEEKLYQSPNCSLKMISEATDIPTHHITIVMKKSVNKRFNDFVNELRIDDIIKEIENSPDNNLTIEGLSNNYGFQSKSTFYRAFKKYKGCTPKEFLNKEKA